MAPRDPVLEAVQQGLSEAAAESLEALAAAAAALNLRDASPAAMLATALAASAAVQAAQDGEVRGRGRAGGRALLEPDETPQPPTLLSPCMRDGATLQPC